MQHAHDDGDELLRADLEELVTRVGLEQLQQVLRRVAVGWETGQAQDFLHLAVQDGDAPDALGVGRGAEEPEEATLTDDVAVLVELLDADVVEVRRTVHRRSGVRLGEDQQPLLARLAAHLGRQLGEAPGQLLVGTQDAQPAAGDREQAVDTLVVRLEDVFAVAEEGEVPVREPAQQLLRLGHLLRADARRRTPLEHVGGAQGGLAHLGPVLDRLPDVAQYALQRPLDLCERSPIGLTVDLEMHPRLDDAVVGRGLLAGGCVE